jgi:hypothetical protein
VSSAVRFADECVDGLAFFETRQLMGADPRILFQPRVAGFFNCYVTQSSVESWRHGARGNTR